MAKTKWIAKWASPKDAELIEGAAQKSIADSDVKSKNAWLRKALKLVHEGPVVGREGVGVSKENGGKLVQVEVTDDLWDLLIRKSTLAGYPHNGHNDYALMAWVSVAHTQSRLEVSVDEALDVLERRSFALAPGKGAPALAALGYRLGITPDAYASAYHLAAKRD